MGDAFQENLVGFEADGVLVTLGFLEFRGPAIPVSPIASSRSRYGNNPASEVTLEPWASGLSRRSKSSLRNRLSIHPSGHPSGEPYQHPKPAYNAMILIPESGCAGVKSQGHLGNAG